MTKVYNATMVPNRTNPPRFAVLTTYERRGKKVTRLLRRYNRGAVTGTKVIPFDRNKDWSRVQGERCTMVPERTEPAPGSYSAEDYANGVALPVRTKVTRDTPRVKVQQTAKRDWLIAGGFVRPNVDLTHDMEWVPGDIQAEVSYSEDGKECYREAAFSDIDLDTCDQAVFGGHYRVKGA